VVLFLLLTVGSGLPVGAFPVIDFDINIKFGQPEQESLILPFAHAVNGSAPVIILSNSTSVEFNVGEYVEYGATASDVEDGDLTGNIFIDYENFDQNTVGNYTLTYFVSDVDNHNATTTRDVIITKPPIQTFFDNAIYQTVEEADPINNVVLGRGESSETIQVGERKFVSSSGLTRWIADSNDKYVERLVTDDVAGVKFESGIFSYYYDKTECGMTVHDIGKIDDNNESFIKYNGWIAKSALNGTDTWTDLEQNNLDCVVSVIDNSEGTKIISVRENSNGKFTETYDIPKPINEMKTTLEFFNNNTALNDHKIAFTNVLDTTPEHYRFLLNQEDIADVYPEDMNDPIEFPQLKGFTTSPATVPISYSQNCNVPTNSTLLDRLEDCVVIIPNGGSVDIPRDDFYVTMYVNATEHPQGLLTDNGFAMDYYSEDKQSWIPVRYEFTNDAMDKLWNVRIVNNQPVENRVFIDYMNINEITAVGETSILDPSVTTPLSEVDIKTVTDNSGTFFGTGTSCTRNPPNLAFTDTFWGQWYAVGGMLGGRYIICTVPMLTFDISSIPDDGSVLQFDFSYDIVSTTFSNNANHRNRWFMGIAEDVRPLNGEDAGRTIFSVTGDNFPENLKFGQFDMTNVGICANIFPCTMSITLADPTTMTDNLELRLESGADWIILSACNYTQGWNPTSANQCGTTIGTSTTRNESWTGDESTILLEITWEIFQPTSAPEQLTCEAVVNDLVLDWSPPTDTGGTPLTGYEVDRSTGGAFQNVAIIPAIPSGWTDTSGIIQGIQYTYRVYPINDLGRGAFAEISCGLAAISDPVVDLTTTNQAVGVVALDWTEPSFTGNTPITGYKIQRTDGSPTFYDEDWFFINHRSTTSAFQCYQASPAGTGVSIGNCGSPSNSRSDTYFFKVFEADDLHGKNIHIDLHGYNRGFLGGCTGSQSVEIYDGEYSIADGGNADFPNTLAKAIKGHGSLQTLWSNACSGTSSIQNFAIDQSFLVDIDDFPNDPIDPSGKVTLMIRHSDTSIVSNGNGFIPLMQGITDISISPFKDWDFTSTVLSTYAEDVPTACTNNCGTYTAGVSNVIDPLGFVTLVPDTGNTQTEYLDNTVLPLTTYGYRVIALNSEGESVNADSNVSIILTAGAPEAPDTPIVTPTGTTDMNIAWSEPNLNNSILQSYTVERKQGVGGIYQVIQSGDTATSLDDGQGLFTLQPATEYCYRVKVITNTGESAFSNEACATTFDAPSIPLNLQVTALDGSSVNMSFDTPTSDGGSPILGYKIERDIGGGGFVTLDALTLTQFRNDTGLPVGTLVTYKVSASNAFGFGDSAQASDTTDATPQVPPNFVCSAGTSDTINLSWDTPVTFSPPTGYLISRNVDGGAFTTLVADTASTATTYTDTPISLDTIYGYKIAAHTSEGDTAFTDEVFCKALSSPDQPPQNFKADFSLVAPHNVVLSWDLPETFGNPVTSLEVERDDGAGYVSLVSLQPNAVGMVDPNPDNDVNQKYRIKIVNPSGESNYAFAIPSDLNRISHFNFENTVDDTGDEKNIATVTGTVAFDDVGHEGTKAFDYDGTSYITVDVAQESDYDFERTTPFGGALYYEGGNAGGATFTDEWYAINHRHNGISVQQYVVNMNSIGVNFDFTGSASGTQGAMYLFKTFNKTDIDGKTFDIDYQGQHRGFLGGCTGYADVRILDGSYDLNNYATDFPNTLPILSKGAGVLQTLHTNACSGTTSVQNWSFDSISPVIDLSSSTESQVTVFFRLLDTNSHPNSNGVFPQMEITDMALNKVGGADERIWDFTTTQGASYTEDDPIACLYTCGTVDSVEISLLGIQALITKAQTLASVGWAFYLDGGFPVLRMNGATQQERELRYL
jgi:hypothetical protein